MTDKSILEFLIRDYYVSRWVNYHQGDGQKSKEDMRQCEEQWITTPGVSYIIPFADPLAISLEIFNKYKNSID